jgi:hypothetical protein
MKYLEWFLHQSAGDMGAILLLIVLVFGVVFSRLETMEQEEKRKASKHRRL